MAELIEHLDRLDADGHPIRPLRRRKRSGCAGAAKAGPFPRYPRNGSRIALAAVIVAGAAVALRQRQIGAAGTAAGRRDQPISLAILPFRNASGDSSLDWLGASLAEMLRTEIGESASLRTVPSDRLHQILRDLRISADPTFDPPTLRSSRSSATRTP